MRLFIALSTFILFSMGLMPGMSLGSDGFNRAVVDGGMIEGTTGVDTTIQAFLGIPYAAPPVGELRWRPPQPVNGWDGIRPAKAFGPRCAQQPVYSDMIFRDSMSEDCLYLNVWTRARSRHDRLPVMVWIHGGGFIAGSSSEPRQDGTWLAQKGIVVVSMNYRLGIFGFLSHPDLAIESEHHASGNYGLLDQVAALQWVQRNIAAFGGDPNNVTIFGESAGSLSVCALIASPLTHGLFQRAIGESGAYFGRKPLTLQESEIIGGKIASSLGVRSIEEMRKIPADEILAVTPKNWPEISTTIDGVFLTEDLESAYTAGKQHHVSLLAGWNRDEGKMSVLFAPVRPTVENFTKRVRTVFGHNADAFLSLYPARNDSEAARSAIDFEGDKFMGLDTWKWIDTQQRTGDATVYRYSFDQTPLAAPGINVGGIAMHEFGARHAGEIEYVFGTFPLTGIPWKEEDRKLSDLIGTYWTNFAATGDPNAPGLPPWPAYRSTDGYQVLHLIAPLSHAEKDSNRARYEFLDAHREWVEAR